MKRTKILTVNIARATPRKPKNLLSIKKVQGKRREESRTLKKLARKNSILMIQSII